MNYYIQGDAARADQIKAAFERLGINVLDFGFADKTVVYCSIGGACVQYLPYSINLMHILYSHPDYRELELPVEPKFKVGDWITDGACKVKITDINNTNYWYSKNCILGEIKSIDKKYHLWTIQDAKDGDVLALNGKPFIYSSHKYGKNYCYIDEWGQLRVNFSLVFEGNYVCPATKQERDLLFSKMREVGYELDANKKELRKIKPHYDISNFKPFDRVLVRQDDSCTWGASFFGRYAGMFMCCNNACFIQCIPYNDDTKHLLGTTDMCPEEYINW